MDDFVLLQMVYDRACDPPIMVSFTRKQPVQTIQKVKPVCACVQRFDDKDTTGINKQKDMIHHGPVCG